MWLLSPLSWPNPSSGDPILLAGAPLEAWTAQVAPVPAPSSLCKGHCCFCLEAGTLPRSPALVAGGNVRAYQGRGHAWKHSQVWRQFLKNSCRGGQHRGLMGDLFSQLGQGRVRSQPGNSYSRGWLHGVNLPVLPAKSESPSMVWMRWVSWGRR